MDIILITILSIVILIFLGIILKLFNIVDEDVVASINAIVINLFLPCMIFNGLYTSDLSNISQLAILPFIILFVGLLIVFISYFIFKSFVHDKKKLWSILTPLMICNTGFIGFPIILSIFSNEGFIRAIFCDISVSFSFLLLSVILVYNFGGSLKTSVKKILTFMPLYGIIFGLAFNLFNIPLTPVISNVVTYLATGTIPLIMISLGLSIDFKSLKENKLVLSLTTIIKLILFPIFVFIIGLCLGITGLEFKILVIQAAMPSGIISLLLVVNQKLDYHLSSDIIFVNIVVSFITLPLVIYAISSM